MALCQVDNKADRSDIILQDQIADVIMLFLPGIFSGLQKIAMGTEIQGHKLTMVTLRTWGRIISLVMKDKLEDDTPSLSTLIQVNNDKHTNQLESSCTKDPALSKFLATSAKESYNKSSENIYKFTQTYKLQKELLSTLSQTTQNLNLFERET